MKNILLSLALGFCASLAQASGFLPLDRATARTLTSSASVRQPTAVILWSSDCPHCKKLMDQLAALTRKHPQLRIVSIAAEPASPTLGALLDQRHLPGLRYAYGDDAPEALAYALDPDWHGEMPRAYLFDGKGKRTVFSGVQPPAVLRQGLGL